MSSIFSAMPVTAEPHDLIFADPPYDKSKWATPSPNCSFVTTTAERLTSEGIFVLEKRPSERLPATDFWEVVRRKTYGATEVIFLQRKSP